MILMHLTGGMVVLGCVNSLVKSSLIKTIPSDGLVRGILWTNLYTAGTPSSFSFSPGAPRMMSPGSWGKRRSEVLRSIYPIITKRLLATETIWYKEKMIKLIQCHCTTRVFLYFVSQVTGLVVLHHWSTAVLQLHQTRRPHHRNLRFQQPNTWKDW